MCDRGATVIGDAVTGLRAAGGARLSGWAERARVVLVVGDDGTVRRHVAAAARALGPAVGPVEALAVRDGEAALRVLRQVVPDLVLIPLDLPGISALELCRWVRAHPQLREVPVVAITGSADDEPIRQQAIDAGCSRLLARPIARAAVGRTLRAHLGRRAG